jgi:hypothetical protein
MNSYDNQIFLSYAREQRAVAEGFVNEMRAAGLTVWWDKDIRVGTESWRKKIDGAIKNSRHFLLYCTVQAKASDMVNHEIRTFRADAKSDPSRKLFVLRAPDCEVNHVPHNLVNVQHADHLNDVIVYVLKESRDELAQRFREFEKKTEKETKQLEQNLALERQKVNEAREYYRHRRFWGPFAENRDVHIFTCGRDIPPDPNRPRGTGGFRTNIDKWDYRAVLGIAHFFASNYPGIKLTIEDPASKLQQEDIVKVHVLANRIAEIGNLLKDKDCIIIGSPDVNDFAEVVLSRIHRINPYDNDRKKSKGFILIRESKNTASAFYWQARSGEQEGIGCLGQEPMLIYKHEPPSMEAGLPRAGKMHGLLVVAQNPFCRSEPRRIMILSGFSGVATNAMAKFLTEDAYLPSFFAFDDKVHALRARSIEAVIGVKYAAGPGSENKDARMIDDAADSITFEEFVPV